MTTAPKAPMILVVDDDHGLLILIEGVLRAERWEVAIAASGADALAWLKNNSADLLLIDLKLSDIDGREFISALAKAGHAIPFMVITGQGDERVAVEMMKRGAIDYLVKDTHFVEFLPTVVRRGLDQLAKESRLADTEEALRRSEAMLARTQRIAHVGGYEIDASGMGGHHWSDESLRILGLDPATKEWVPSEHLIHSIHPEDRARVRKAFDRSRSKRVRFDLEYRIVRPDGSIRHVLSIVEPVPDPDEGGIRLAGTLQDITERKRLEQEILNISEREQRRFGRDLHDGLGQRLTGLEMLSHGLAEDLKGAPALARQARRLNRELRETVTQARLISHGLAPVPLEGDGLMQGLKELAASTSRIPGVHCQFFCAPPVRLQDLTMATHLYRIAQEAVNNALKHGRATKLAITLAERADELELSVKNNGCAIPATTPANGGTGLNVMRYRAGVIGASLSIESGKRRGVRVLCTLGKKA